MHSTAHLTRLSWFLLGGCCTASGIERDRVAPNGGATPHEVPEVQASFALHEWGLIRGTPVDTSMLSGPRGIPPILPMAKPVLYFHRLSPGALEIDVEVRIAAGRMIEVWPRSGDLQAELGPDAHWRVGLGTETCAGAHYPTPFEAPCDRLLDGCETAELRMVESPDATCVTFATGADQTPASWNHLFYRGEVIGDPALPLVITAEAEGGLRVSQRGNATVRGQVVRTHQSGAGAIQVGSLPSAGGPLVFDGPPTDPISLGPSTLHQMLLDAGLTRDEADAFGRAWNETLFGTSPATTTASPAGRVTAVLGGGHVPRPAPNQLLYVLPEAYVESLATLRVTPRPASQRRVIVAWVEEPALP